MCADMCGDVAQRLHLRACERVEKVRPNRLDVSRRSAVDRGQARFGQLDEGAARVGGAALSRDEPPVFHSPDLLRQLAPVPFQALSQVAAHHLEGVPHLLLGVAEPAGFSHVHEFTQRCLTRQQVES